MWTPRTGSSYVTWSIAKDFLMAMSRANLPLSVCYYL
jgi:hypothetical protein